MENNNHSNSQQALQLFFDRLIIVAGFGIGSSGTQWASFRLSIALKFELIISIEHGTETDLKLNWIG